VSHRLTLLTVHGHPDDESVNTGGVMARYAMEGTRVVCVVCTRGERGEIVVPVLDTPTNRARLGEIREGELVKALGFLGPIEYHVLGYGDSGTMGSPTNLDPHSFWQADPDEAAGRMVLLIRRVRPDVIVTCNEFGGDGHPDHIRASEIARMAYERSGDPNAYPEQLVGPDAVEPWAVSKLYETVIQLHRREKVRRLMASGSVRTTVLAAVRYVRRWRPGQDALRPQMAAAQRPATTRVDVGPWLEAKYSALAAHVTQVRPNSRILALTPAERRLISPTEDFTLRASRVATALPETDLFAGLR
jgi:LmbE family N-acetylglucosaminyl deacetylase